MNGSSPVTSYPTLQDWLNEAEGYGVRAEHIPPGAYPWIAEAWKLGAASAGHAQGPADGVADFARRCQAYLDDAPLNGRHSDAAGADAYELIAEAACWLGFALTSTVRDGADEPRGDQS